MLQPPSTLQDLIAKLSAMEPGPIEPDQVAKTLRNAHITAEEIRPHLRFQVDRYTRNLMYRSEVFDVVALYWPPGAETPVHDHRDQWGWVRVLDGALEEIRYSTEGQPDRLDETARWAPEEFSRKRIYADRTVAAVDKEHGIHQLTALDQPAISLHIYSKPHESCLVFCGNDGEIQRKELEYDSTPDSRTKLFT